MTNLPIQAGIGLALVARFAKDRHQVFGCACNITALQVIGVLTYLIKSEQDPCTGQKYRQTYLCTPNLIQLSVLIASLRG